MKSGRTRSDSAFATVVRGGSGDYVAFSGVAVRRLLSRDLFADVAGLDGALGSREVHHECRTRWVTLANRLAASQRPVECLMVLGVPQPRRGKAPAVGQAFLAMGRGATGRTAAQRAVRGAQELGSMLSETFDQVEVEPVVDSRALQALCALVNRPHVVEVTRRLEAIRPWHGDLLRREVGFHASPAGETKGGESGGEEAVTHLFPWTPGDDSWEHLLAALLREGPGVALVAHLQGRGQAPEAVQREAVSALAVAERTARLQIQGRKVQTVLSIQAELLRREALLRVSLLQGRVVAARLFVGSRRRASQSLLTSVLSALDSSATASRKAAGEALFHGGAELASRSRSAVIAPLDRCGPEHFFGLQEATSFLRTPVPAVSEMPGLVLKRARTLPLTGLPGRDCLLGSNVHRGRQVEVRLDAATRFRHTYVIGQTGTGKSTLLLNMIVHDLWAGRGVAVLDPHGCLVEEVLRSYPPERADDLVLVDLSDGERPVGLNILRIEEQDPLVYRRTRDLIIDDLFSYLHRTYMQETMGPIFESHLRSVLALLMGNEPQQPPLIPSLMVFRALYTNRKLRKALGERVKGQDVVIDEFLEEAEAVCGEGSLANMAPYITSKFSRFVTDVALRNITCQARTLDFDDIVTNGKVLLVYLGKGKFGDHAAGLLASQLVSRLRHAVMKRGSGQRNRPFYLYADEFQLLADDRFAEMLAEARKFGLSLTLAHQYVEQLPEQVLRAVVGNVGTLIALRVGARDGDFLAPVYRPHFSSRDLVSQANYRACVKASGALGETPFSLELAPPPSNPDKRLAQRLRTLSRTHHGRPREQVEAEIAQTYAAFREFREG